MEKLEMENKNLKQLIVILKLTEIILMNECCIDLELYKKIFSYCTKEIFAMDEEEMNTLREELSLKFLYDEEIC